MATLCIQSSAAPSAVRLRSRPFARCGAVASLFLVGLGIPAARAESKETETVTRTAAFSPGASLTVRNFSGVVVITGSDRPDVSVHAVRRATREQLERIKLEVREEGGGVTIEANQRQESGRERDNVVETDLTIELPRQANLDINAFSSPITVRDVTGSRHRVKTFSGDQKLERLAGSVEADTFSGSITFMPEGWADRLKLNTFSGDIDVQVPATAGGSVEFDTFSGDFSTDVPLTLRSKAKRAVRADFPGGDTTKATLLLHTFSGDVRVRR
jgi:DUF4097 and DUF4098 domain-containing protein YvlB